MIPFKLAKPHFLVREYTSMSDKKTPPEKKPIPPRRIVVSSHPNAEKDPLRPYHHEVVSSPIEASSSFSLGEKDLDTPKESIQPKVPPKQKEVSSMNAEKDQDDNPPANASK